MDERWPLCENGKVRCCYHCEDRLVTEHYNCHDHCQKYLAEKALAHAGDAERYTDTNIYGQREQAVRKAQKKWRHRHS